MGETTHKTLFNQLQNLLVLKTAILTTKKNEYFKYGVHSSVTHFPDILIQFDFLRF